MIDIQKIYDMLAECLKQFGAVAKFTSEGGFDNIPPPEELKALADGDKFALIFIPNIVPEYTGGELWKPRIQYEICLVEKGRIGDIIKKRNTLLNYLANFNYSFRAAKHGQPYKNTILNIFLENNKIEKDWDCIAIIFVGEVEIVQPLRKPLTE